MLSCIDMAEATRRYAVVTGANKGIGFGVVEQLASQGIPVVLTARNEERGVEAVENLKRRNLAGDILFHQLNVSDDASVASLADFVKNKFGKLDILINNAGVISGKPVEDMDVKKFEESLYNYFVLGRKEPLNYREFLTETPESAEECMDINYYGTKRMCEAMNPLLLRSDSPRIVNVSSSAGSLMHITNGWAKTVLGDAENLTEEKIDEVLKKCVESIKEGAPSWAVYLVGYSVSKAAINAYTRVLAKKFPAICANAVCPGYVRTDIGFKTGMLSIEEGAESVVRLALLGSGGASGCYFSRKEMAAF